MSIHVHERKLCHSKEKGLHYVNVFTPDNKFLAVVITSGFVSIIASFAYVSFIVGGR